MTERIPGLRPNEIFKRTYHRDRQGQFASTGSSGGGGGGPALDGGGKPMGTVDGVNADGTFTINGKKAPQGFVPNDNPNAGNFDSQIRRFKLQQTRQLKAHVRRAAEIGVLPHTKIHSAQQFKDAYYKAKGSTHAGASLYLDGLMSSPAGKKFGWSVSGGGQMGTLSRTWDKYGNRIKD